MVCLACREDALKRSVALTLVAPSSLYLRRPQHLLRCITYAISSWMDTMSTLWRPRRETLHVVLRCILRRRSANTDSFDSRSWTLSSAFRISTGTASLPSSHSALNGNSRIGGCAILRKYLTPAAVCIFTLMTRNLNRTSVTGMLSKFLSRKKVATRTPCNNIVCGTRSSTSSFIASRNFLSLEESKRRKNRHTILLSPSLFHTYSTTATVVQFLTSPRPTTGLTETGEWPH
mmetsp:Transcript_5018/g.10420  ORF Transcript_5018/g.10420 Transcript_5018/m.10420 type:complete len:232 (+) Transcript_5018:1247-1942(+)